MKIGIISFRKGDDKRILALENEYLKRIRPYVRFEMTDIKLYSVYFDLPISEDALRKMENDLKKKGFVVFILSEYGDMYDSGGFADMISGVRDNGGNIAFIIGGPAGFEKDVLCGRKNILSLSKMTFPHKIARLLLIEAIYRSFSMIFGLKYHK